jgi:hypothetical protein
MHPSGASASAGDTLASVLILPPGHAQSVSRTPRPLTRRERMLVRGVLALIAAAAVAVGVAVGFASSSPAGRGCIDVTVASSIGAQPISGCGTRARSLCLQVGDGGFTGTTASLVASACRRAGVPVRVRSSSSGAHT